MALLKTIFSSLALGVNTVLSCLLMVPWALLKLLLPLRPVRAVCDRVLNAIATNWISVNGWWMQAVNHTRWQVTGLDGLDPRGWYLVISNHQSWVDILALQKVLNRRIPLLKFFIKQELIWVPVIGLAWWALDFPFLKRGGGATAEQDLETTRKACEKFRLVPTSVISFAEGTRLTAAKHAEQQSPYRHLLKPKSGGVGMALATMGDMFTGVIDATIVYPEGVPTFGDLLAGRAGAITIEVRVLPVPVEVVPPGQPLQRMGMQRWVTRLWRDKDARIERLGGTAMPATAKTRSGLADS